MNINYTNGLLKKLRQEKQTSFVTTSHSPSLARIRNSRELSIFSSCNFSENASDLISAYSTESFGM